MKKLLLVAALVLAIPVQAATYDVFNSGIDFWNEESWDDAIVCFNAVLAAGDLSPSQQRIAIYDRGRAYLAKNQPEKAIPDYSKYLELVPDEEGVLVERAFAYQLVRKPEKAAEDLQAARKLSPGDDMYLDLATGVLDWQQGNYKDAADAFSKKYLSDRRSVYLWLWLQITLIRQGGESDKSPPHDAGKSPIVQLYIGRESPETVIRFGEDTKNKSFHCGIDFYVGEWQLLHGKIDLARDLLKKAADTCAVDDNEKLLALVELDRIAEKK